MLQAFIAFCLIWVIAGASMLIRWIAFSRMDSWAMEISVAALIYNILYGVYASETVADFCHKELLRCIVLLMFALAIAGIHLHYAFVCRDKCGDHFNNAILILRREAEHTAGIYFKEVGDTFEYDDDDEEYSMTGGAVYAEMTPEERFRLEDMKQSYLSKLVILKEANTLAKSSLSVCYSIFIDAFSYNRRGILRHRKKKDGGASKGFRPKKTGVRIALASIINNLHIDGMPTLHEDDFNISMQQQKTGLILFDVFEVLSLIVGCRVVDVLINIFFG